MSCSGWYWSRVAKLTPACSRSERYAAQRARNAAWSASITAVSPIRSRVCARAGGISVAEAIQAACAATHVLRFKRRLLRYGSETYRTSAVLRHPDKSAGTARQVLDSQRFGPWHGDCAVRLPTIQYNGRQHARAQSEERRVGKECRSRWSPYH